MGIREEYRDALLPRFAGREALPLDEWHRRFAPDASRTDLQELFELFESAYEIPTGLLRPGDEVRLLSEPVRGDGWLQRFRFWGVARDAGSELFNEVVFRHPRRTRSGGAEAEIRTVGELVTYWCGVLAESG